jgi:hypothetical protein
MSQQAPKELTVCKHPQLSSVKAAVLPLQIFSNALKRKTPVSPIVEAHPHCRQVVGRDVRKTHTRSSLKPSPAWLVACLVDILVIARSDRR